MDIRLDQIQVTDRMCEEADRFLFSAAVRLDTNDTAHFARQLEHLKATTYDIEFGKLKSLGFIPADTSASPGAESITYQQWTEVESAVVVANMSDDLPQVDTAAREFTSAVKSIGSSYQWSIQDVRRAADAGMGFMLRKARAARLSIDRRIDAAGAFGIPEAGTTGLVNNAAVPLVVLPTLGAWTGLTPTQILANMNFLASSIPIATGEVETPNTLLLDTVSFNHVAVTPFLGGDGTVTILKAFLENQPYVTQVDQWTRLNTAGAAGIHRAVCYDRSDRVLQYNLPLMFEQLPPQPHNLAFKVPVHARIGVVEMHYPLGVAYADIAL
jgi:hypothetical protein